MKIAIIGTGYVGLPTGVGFAELGYNVVCIDKVKEKIDDLNNGKITLYEKGLEELFHKNRSSGRLSFTTDLKEGIDEAEVIIIAVGTPPHPGTGEADLSFIYAAVKELASNIKNYTVIATKSTVPVGTNDIIESIIKETKPTADFDVVSLPEFLREGFAVEDFFYPDRIVVGVNSEKAKKVIEELYKPFEGKSNFLFVNRRSAETIKYASNSFLSIKIHFINEMADFCEKAEADIDEVAKGMGLDSRIGPKFLQPGPGYGGSCFPKDTMAMNEMAKKLGVELSLVNTTIEQNHLRKVDMAERTIKLLKNVQEPTAAVLGLAFKAGTDDIRESPAITIVERLLEKGIKVKAYDPKAIDNAKGIFGNKIEYSDSIEDACIHADIILILTEWEDFKNANYGNILKSMNNNIIFDTRNILDENKMRHNGYKYYRIGKTFQ